MGTITDKMNRLLQTKSAIREAIIEKGQSVAESAPFSSYAGKILKIQTGTDTSDVTIRNSSSGQISATYPSSQSELSTTTGTGFTTFGAFYLAITVSKIIPSVSVTGGVYKNVNTGVSYEYLILPTSSNVTVNISGGGSGSLS